MRKNRMQVREERKNKLAYALQGSGLFVYLNPNNADYMLSKPLKNGQRVVGPKKEFEGDDYFMQFVKRGELRLIKTIVSAEQERTNKMNEEKLILDQPDTVTVEGKVEHVCANSESVPLTEDKKCKGKCKKNESNSPKDVLLNENPIEGVDIVL